MVCFSKLAPKRMTYFSNYLRLKEILALFPLALPGFTGFQFPQLVLETDREIA